MDRSLSSSHSHSHTQTLTPTPTFHSSHPHPLNPIYLNSQHQHTLNPSSTCAGCKLRPFGMVLACMPCNYFLHKKCFHMPNNITHPFHKNHGFTLLHVPAYSNGVFNCNACDKPGTGFSFHCKPCGLDLHVLCAAMPLFVSHASHVHKLELTFERPYGGLPYNCDICKRDASGRHWLYRCKSCGFDAHLACARGVQTVRPQSNINSSNTFHSQSSMPHLAATSTPNPAGIRPHHQAPNPISASVMSQLAAAKRMYSTVNTLQAIHHMIPTNHATSVSHGMLAGSAGGLDAAGYDGLNGIDDGRWQEIPQALMNVGDDGSLDFMQNSMGDDGGSGAGLYFLQNLTMGDDGGGDWGDFMQNLGDDGSGGSGWDTVQNLMGDEGLDYGGGFDLIDGLGGLFL